jgi:APA family basic amino acid/polyamine antiporter
MAAVKTKTKIKNPLGIKAPEKLKLKRELSLLHATIYGVGVILGAGVYVLIGRAAGIAGNSVWASFLIAALVAAFTGLSYAELSSAFPKDSGEYLYALKAFGKRAAFVIGYLVIVSEIIAAAAVSLGFAGYFSALLNIDHLVWIAMAVIVVFSLVNFIGIKEAARLNILFTAIEVGGLFLIIAIGSKFIGKVNYLESAAGYSGIFSAAALIFFAFIGFESIVKLSEETKNPTKIIPRALILSIIITTIIYVLVAIAAVSVMGWEALGASKAPLADVAAMVLGSKAFILLSAIALFSTANTVLIILISTSRLMYGMSKLRCLPKILCAVHPKTHTPHFSVLVVGVLALLFSLLGDIRFVAEITNFAVFATFIIVNASLIGLRVKNKRYKAKFRVPLNIRNIPVLPVLGVLVSLFMLLNLDKPILVIGVGLIALGFILEKVFRP